MQRAKDDDAAIAESIKTETTDTNSEASVYSAAEDVSIENQVNDKAASLHEEKLMTAQESLQTGAQKIVRFVMLISGGTIFTLGIIIIPLPGPFGLPIALVGLILLMRSSQSVRRYMARFKRRQPNLFMIIQLLRRKKKPSSEREMPQPPSAAD